MSAPVVYTLLIYSSRPPDKARPDEHDEVALAHHRALQAEASERGELLAVARLDDAPARSVGARSEEATVIDGPYIESKEWLVGYYLLECPDEEVALRRARQICCHDDIRVEVRAVSWNRVG